MTKEDQHQRLRNEILWELESNEWSMDVLPHYGLTPDWNPRYHRLANLVREYLESEREELGAQQWEESQRQRHMQRESQSLSSASPLIES